MPMKANTAIWKPAKKPLMPFGNMPPSFHRWVKEATVPVGDWNCMAIITNPATISPTMATILIIANQNSISPNIFTVARLRPSSNSTHSSEAIHCDSSGNQNWA
ncbi:Uncharacterised protein [Acinetobacter baumannii]|nr:Uncharacterised protein [Acinetobacter baumannii]